MEGVAGAASAGAVTLPTPRTVDSSVAIKMRRRGRCGIEGSIRCMRIKPIYWREAMAQN